MTPNHHLQFIWCQNAKLLFCACSLSLGRCKLEYFKDLLNLINKQLGSEALVKLGRDWADTFFNFVPCNFFSYDLFYCIVENKREEIIYFFPKNIKLLLCCQSCCIPVFDR